MATLQEVRAQHDLTQLQLATATGLSLSTVTGLEAGRHRPSYATHQALRRVLGPAYDTVEFPPGPQPPRPPGRPRRPAPTSG